MPEHSRCDSNTLAVSVILPTHNSGSFVSRAIDSILGQRGDPHLELIVVDDCSSDETAQRVQNSYGSDPRVTFISSSRNAGPGAARNRALEEAKGEWIALIDADDAWAEDRLSALLPLCSADVDVLFDNIVGYDQAAGVRTGLLFPSLPRRMTIKAMAAERAPKSTFNYGYLKPLIRREFLRRTKLRYPEVRISEDLLFYLELLVTGARTKTVDQGFYIYTTSLGQISGRRSALSATRPDDALVGQLLDGLAEKYQSKLQHEEVEAITSRAEHLRRTATLSRLYDDWTRGHYLAVTRSCVVHRAARQHLFRALSKRLFR